MSIRSVVALVLLSCTAAAAQLQSAELPPIPMENRLKPLPGARAPKPLDIAIPPYLKSAAGPGVVKVAEPLNATQVVVIAVKGDADSESVAKYYMDQRGIPAVQLLLVDLPGNDGDGIPRGKFKERVVNPLREMLANNPWGREIRCLVSAYRMPIYVIGEKVALDPQETDFESILQNTAAVEQHNNTTAAAFDSELSILFADQKDRDLCGWTDNPAFEAWGVSDLRTLGVFVTGRIDGPTPAIAKGLVDQALAVEKTGLAGKAYFDARKKAFAAPALNYDLGERWMRLSSLHARNAGFDTTLDEDSALYGEKGWFSDHRSAPDCALYYGWYALTNFHDAFQSKPAAGALMIHLASGEGQIRFSKQKPPDSPLNGGPWCLGFLRMGATGTCGPVQEPFLTAFPSDAFFEALFRGYTAGEAYALSLRHTSWMMHYIGDPLYRPFVNHPRTDFVYTRGQLRDGELGSRGILFYTGNNNTLDLAVGRPWGAFKGPFQLRVMEKSNELEVDLAGAVCEPEEDGHGLRIKNIKFIISGDTEFPKPNRGDFQFRFLELDLGLTDTSAAGEGGKPAAEKILPVTILARPSPRAKKPAPAQLPKAPPPKE